VADTDTCPVVWIDGTRCSLPSGHTGPHELVECDVWTCAGCHQPCSNDDKACPNCGSTWAYATGFPRVDIVLDGPELEPWEAGPLDTSKKEKE